MIQIEPKTRFWILLLVLTIVVVWLLKPILLPFAAGFAIAFFLDPVVNNLTRRGMPRWLAAISVLCIFLVVIGLLALLIVPVLQEQIVAFIHALPGYIEKIHNSLIPRVERWLARLPEGDVEKIRDAAGQYAGSAAGLVGKALEQIVSGGLAIIDIITLLIFMPVVAFYLMRDWPSLTAIFDSLLPRRHYNVIKEQLGEIDRTLAGFVRGQALVCVCLAFMYGGGFALVGIPYSAAIGVTSGILSFIPYVGTAFAGVCGIVLALVQFDGLTHVGMVLIVLAVGQVLETYILTPRLVGQRIGLHPVWVLFALMAGAQLMGFVGVLIAVPVAAVLGVLTRFAAQRYKNSALYEDPTAPKQL